MTLLAPTHSRVKPLFRNFGSTELFGKSAASRLQTLPISSFADLVMNLLSAGRKAPAFPPGLSSE